MTFCTLYSIKLKIILNHVTVCKLQISSSLRAIINRNDDPVLQDFSCGGRTLRQLENLATNELLVVFRRKCGRAKKRESRAEGEFQSKNNTNVTLCYAIFYGSYIIHSNYIITYNLSKKRKKIISFNNEPFSIRG